MLASTEGEDCIVDEPDEDGLKVENVGYCGGWMTGGWVTRMANCSLWLIGLVGLYCTNCRCCCCCSGISGGSWCVVVVATKAGGTTGGATWTSLEEGGKVLRDFGEYGLDALDSQDEMDD